MRCHQEWLLPLEEAPSRTLPALSNMVHQAITTPGRHRSLTITTKTSSSNRTPALTHWVSPPQTSFAPSRPFLLPPNSSSNKYRPSRLKPTSLRLRPMSSTSWPRCRPLPRWRRRLSTRRWWPRSRRSCRSRRMRWRMRSERRTRGSTRRR
jgi:hypothetical protein